jgi:hypothetical protein
MDPADAAKQFEDFCQDAGIKLEDGCPTTNNARATWHDFQVKAGAVLREIAEEYGEEQDYDDIASMLDYPGQGTKEKLRQMLFLRQYKSVLPDEAYSREHAFIPDVLRETTLDEF